MDEDNGESLNVNMGTGNSNADDASIAANDLSRGEHVPLSRQLGMQPLPPKFTGATNIEEIREHLENFCNQREWQAFHTPRYLLLDLLKNTGLLAEFFQRPGLGENPGEFQRGDTIPRDDKQRLGEMIADTQLSLLRLGDVCGVNVGISIREKLLKNEAKFPVDKYRGRTDLTDDNGRTPGGKRKRFTDGQLRALSELAEIANWSLLSVPKDDRDKFCRDHDITKERLHNFFNNRKPKDLKKIRTGKSGEDGDEGGEGDTMDNM